jgi:hypothetical protein
MENRKLFSSERTRGWSHWGEKKLGGKDGIMTQMTDILSIVLIAKSLLSAWPPLACERLSKYLNLQV